MTMEELIRIIVTAARVEEIKTVKDMKVYLHNQGICTDEKLINIALRNIA